MPAIQTLLPELSDEDEAVLLGVETTIASILEKLNQKDVNPSNLNMPLLEFYAVVNWAETKNERVTEVLALREANPQKVAGSLQQL